jgi:PAS domain S-box-containing protein
MLSHSENNRTIASSADHHDIGNKLQATIGEAAAVIDENGRIVNANAPFCTLLQRSADELEGMDLLSLCLDERITGGAPFAKWVSTLKRENLTESTYLELIGIRQAEGDIRWVTAYLTLLSSSFYQKPCRILRFYDITSIRKIEALEIQSTERYQELVESANSLIIRLDPSHRILFANRYATEILGYSLNELLGANLHQFLLAEPGNEVEMNAIAHKVYAAASSHAFYDGFDQECTCRDGRTIWVYWSVRALRDSDGAMRELLCIGIDITVRKQAELAAEIYRKRVRQLSERLSRVEDRERANIADYLHDQIIQQLSLSSMQLGSILHELDGMSPSIARRKINSVRVLIDDAAKLCRSVMDDLVPSYLHELGLIPALEQLVNKLDRPMDTEITIQAPIENPKMPQETANALFKAIRELLMNALKYAQATTITIGLERQPQLYCVTVEDDGCGFSTESLEHHCYDENGGFGLFSVRERIEAMNGELRIDSAPGRGTRATILLPA